MKRPRRKSINELTADCIVWNHHFPVGSKVRYHPVIGEPEYRESITTAEAYVLSGHTAVVHLAGIGLVALDACEAYF